MTPMQTHPRSRAAPAGWTLAILALGASAAPVSMADIPQSLEEITATVTSYVQREYSDLGTISAVQVNSLDPRLNLPACGSPLEAFPANGQRRLGNATIGVRCGGERPWTLYVPVKIVSEVAVLAAAHPLKRGDVLKESDLVPINRDAAALPHGYFVDHRKLVGMQLKRGLRAGDAVTPAAVSAPPLVERGQQVLLTAAVNGISVTMKGEALEDGAAGDRIQVRNLSSRRVIEAEVVGRNQVRVLL